MRSRWRGVLLLTMLAFVPGCFSASSARRADDSLTGLASWYGQEFAGRTTANGEIFDPQQLTAAHRTLPFGTILQVKNPKNDKTVQVRINDRGPFVGNRVIDLSYGAAAQLEMVNSGIAQVELKVLKFGAGDREPPAPLVVKAGDPVRIAPSPVTRDSAPAIEFPLPPDVDNIASRQDTNPDPAIVEQIEVVEERAGQVLRKQVSDDGTTVTRAPDPNAPAPTRRTTEPRTEPRPLPAPTRFVAQLGAFSSAENANQLADRVRDIATNVYVEPFRDLHRVRVGPFASREAATEVKEKLDVAGIAAIVVPE